MGFWPPHTLCVLFSLTSFESFAKVEGLMWIGIKASVLRDPNDDFRSRKRPTRANLLLLLLLPHTYTLPFSFGTSWGSLPPMSAPQAEVVCYKSPCHSL